MPRRFGYPREPGLSGARLQVMLAAAADEDRQPTGALIRALVSSLIAAVVLTGTGGNWAPTWLQVSGSVLPVLLYVRLGRTASWWSLPLATAAIFGVGASASALFYDQSDVPPDRRLTGIDQIGVDPGTVTIVLPFVWVLLVLAIVSRRWPRPPRTAETG